MTLNCDFHVKERHPLYLRDGEDEAHRNVTCHKPHKVSDRTRARTQAFTLYPLEPTSVSQLCCHLPVSYTDEHHISEHGRIACSLLCTVKGEKGLIFFKSRTDPQSVLGLTAQECLASMIRTARVRLQSPHRCENCQKPKCLSAQ